jgi:uncharacterized protein (DUF1778 family)
MNKSRATIKSGASRNASKTARLEARITPQQKKLIELAAAYEGRSVSDFVVNAIAQAARTVVADYEVLRLNPEQSRSFVERLLNPTAPNRALRRAAERYRRTVRSR